MQTMSATYHRKPIMTDDFYNSWVEPSKYPRIPNVYEPIQDTQVSGQCGIREKKESAWVHQDSRDSHQSAWTTNRKPLSSEEPHQWLVNDRTNYSVVVQLGSSYRSENQILGDDFKDASRDWHSPSHHPDSIEKRRARREASFEKWKDAGDRVFCHSARFGHDFNQLKA